MHKLTYTDNQYNTLELQSKSLFPSLTFYFRLFFIVLRASMLAKKKQYSGSDWVDSSFEVMQRLEKVGVNIEVSGIENVAETKGPVVFIGNHMSMMETLLLPVMVQPLKSITFVVKETLLSYPIFKHIMCSRDPIAVSRTNPRQDLKAVMSGGLAKLKSETSIIVFPQTTRSNVFNPKQMSSIGVKLAKKAGVPVIPIALKTDCWQNGKRFKDFGKLDLSKKAHFSFGKPVIVESKGDQEQADINTFIAEKLRQWGGDVQGL